MAKVKPEEIPPEVLEERQMIVDAKSRGRLATLGAYTKLSGPGWLQSAITLGGGSLASSLYLGVLGGVSLLWLQPLAMIIGVIMLCAISYVTLSTEQRPFRAINSHVNPVLGWGWLLATMMANLVWALPQFSLATASVRQNLLPSVLSPQVMNDTAGRLLVCLPVAVICIIMVWFYDSGKTGVRVFGILLKTMVGAVIICFFGVLVKLSFIGEGMDWSAVFSGFIPDLSLLTAPTKSLTDEIARVAPAFQEYWSDIIVSQQQSVMIAAAATAVGINMTFLLPYSMLKRGWDRNFRGLAIFDLATGLFVPFLLATACVVIVSATQFHSKPAKGFLGETDATGAKIEPDPAQVAKYEKLAAERIEYELGEQNFGKLTDEQIEQRIDELPRADKRMAAMLIKRDAFDLANSLSPFTGKIFSHYIFGIGVVGMAISSIIILMVINGFVICEIFDLPHKGWPYRAGAMLPLVGILGPFIWTGGKAQFWLAVPTSNIAFVLLPIAYLSFVLVLNSKRLLGADMPRGTKRLVWNVIMIIALTIVALGCMWKLWSGLGSIGIALLVGFIVLCLIVSVIRRMRGKEEII